jgi:hypothetical protein
MIEIRNKLFPSEFQQVSSYVLNTRAPSVPGGRLRNQAFAVIQE